MQIVKELIQNALDFWSSSHMKSASDVSHSKSYDDCGETNAVENTRPEREPSVQHFQFREEESKGGKK